MTPSRKRRRRSEPAAHDRVAGRRTAEPGASYVAGHVLVAVISAAERRLLRAGAATAVMVQPGFKPVRVGPRRGGGGEGDTRQARLHPRPRPQRSPPRCRQFFATSPGTRGAGGGHSDPGYMSRKIRKFRTDKFDT